jgi:hypothetical protein
MRRCFIVCGLSGLTVLVLACSGKVNVTPPSAIGPSTPREKLFVADVALQEEAASILATVVDQASLNRAKPKLTTLVSKHDKLKQDMQKLTPATLQKAAEVRRKFGDRSKAARENLSKEMTRVNSTIPGGGEVYRQLLRLWQGL